MNNNDKLIKELERARNELCEQCKNYQFAHTGRVMVATGKTNGVR